MPILYKQVSLKTYRLIAYVMSQERNLEVGKLFQDMQKENYSLIEYYARIEGKCWTFAEVPKPNGGREHYEIKAPDFILMGIRKWEDLEDFIIVPDESKNLGNYKLYPHLAYDKIVSRMCGLPRSILSGHVDMGDTTKTIVKKAGIFHAKTPYQILPEHSESQKREIGKISLRQTALALEYYFGETTECLCSPNVELTILDRKTIQVTSDRLSKQFTLSDHQAGEFVYLDGLRPLDFFYWMPIEDGRIGLSVPARWHVYYNNNFPEVRGRSSPNSVVLTWN